MMRSFHTMTTLRRSALVLLGLLAPAALSAQERLVGSWTGSTGAFYENWSFPTAIAVTTGSSGNTLVSGASQLTIPVAAVVPIVENWTFDVYTAYVRGQVRAMAPDGSARSPLTLNGLTDTKLRVVGQLHGDDVLLTAGLTAPTGATGLGTEQLDAMSVLSAPALRFRSPVLGAGAGATLGLILARQLGGWGMAFGSSYEARGSYAPAEALQAGISDGSLRPGNAAHFSLAGERVSGSLRHMLSVAGDIYQAGELRDASTGAGSSTLALGPTFTGTYQLDATAGSYQTTAFVVGRRRAEYKLAGETVAGSARTEVEAGAQALHAMSPGAALRLALEGRVHSAPATSDAATPLPASFSTAGVTAGGATVAIRFGSEHGGFAFEPFVRAQVARLDFSTTTQSATGLSGGATITARF